MKNCPLLRLQKKKDEKTPSRAFVVCLPAGSSHWRPHQELPAGKVSSGVPEPGGEELPHLLPTPSEQGHCAVESARARRDARGLQLPFQGKV